MTHYIAMSGSHGCLPDWLCCVESEADAVDAAVDMFADILTEESEPEFRSELQTEGYVSLRGTDAGAEYVEVVSCDCATPEDHDDA